MWFHSPHRDRTSFIEIIIRFEFICMGNIYNSVCHLNKLQGINVQPLCFSQMQTFCPIGRVKFTWCVVILMLFLSSLQICAMMTYLHVELLQFLLLARSIWRSFLRTAQSIQQYAFTEWNSLSETTYCRSWTRCGFDDTGMPFVELTFFHSSIALELEHFNYV